MQDFPIFASKLSGILNLNLFPFRPNSNNIEYTVDPGGGPSTEALFNQPVNKQTTNSDQLAEYEQELISSTSSPDTLNDKSNSNNNIDYSDTFYYTKISVTLTIGISGLITNSLSILIIINQGLINSGVWVYLTGMAIFDNIAIIVNFIYNYSKPPANFLWSIPMINDISCKIMSLFSHCFSGISYYLLGFMTVERAILIFNPYRTPPSQKQAIISTVIISITVTIIQDCYICLFFGIVKVEIPDPNNNDLVINLRRCTITPEYENYIKYITLADTIFYAIIPIVLVISANICISYALIKRARNQTLNIDKSKINKDRNITIMLLSISCLLLVTLTPWFMFLFTYKYFYKDFREATSFGSVGFWIVGLLSYSNHSFNFWFYVCSGEIFREKAKLFFKKLFRFRNT